MSAAEPSLLAVESDVPEGWVWARVSEVTEYVPNAKPEAEPDRVFGYVDISSICNKTFRITDAKRFKGKDAPSRARRPIKPGDVLFSNVRTYLRNIALVPHDLGAQLCSTGFTVLRCNGAIEPDFLFYQVLTDRFIELVTPQQTGSQYPATSDRVVMSATMLVPPLAEQKRIVKRVEQLLARVNAARERLTHAAAILKRFRQSVLTAACSDGESLPLSELVLDIKYGTAQKCTPVPTGSPVIRIPNIGDGSVMLDDLKYAKLPSRELASLQLLPGDILVIRSNGSVSLVGKTALVSEREAGFAYAGYLIRLRVNRGRVLPEYLNLALQTHSVREQIEIPARSTSGVHNINSTEVLSLKINLPDLNAQKAIVRRIENLFKLADAIEKRVAAAKLRADKLTQAILTKAFRGELVSTEAELARREGRKYEQAAALLQRLRTEGAIVQLPSPSRQPRKSTAKTR